MKNGECRRSCWSFCSAVHQQDEFFQNSGLEHFFQLDQAPGDEGAVENAVVEGDPR
jgi:hypothetical protein